jgi:hypothetical protein
MEHWGRTCSSAHYKHTTAVSQSLDSHCKGPGFSLWGVHAEQTINKMTLGQDFLGALWVSPASHHSTLAPILKLVYCQERVSPDFFHSRPGLQYHWTQHHPTPTQASMETLIIINQPECLQWWRQWHLQQCRTALSLDLGSGFLITRLNGMEASCVLCQCEHGYEEKQLRIRALASSHFAPMYHGLYI